MIYSKSYTDFTIKLYQSNISNVMYTRVCIYIYNQFGKQLCVGERWGTAEENPHTARQDSTECAISGFPVLDASIHHRNFVYNSLCNSQVYVLQDLGFANKHNVESKRHASITVWWVTLLYLETGSDNFCGCSRAVSAVSQKKIMLTSLQIH